MQGIAWDATQDNRKVTKHMIIANLYGGIGNQLFQYCFAHAVGERVRQTVYLNKVGFENRSDGHGEFLTDGITFREMQDRLLCKKSELLFVKAAWKMSDLFAARGKQGSDAEAFFLKRAGYGFIWSHSAESLLVSWDKLTVKSPVVFIDGYFQWPMLMGDTIAHMKEHAVFERPLEGANAIYREQILRNESVCVHIRRGDYTKFPHLQVCNYGYYLQAMEWIRSRILHPVFYLFSDDMEWVREHYQFPGDVVYIEERNVSSVELHLMSCCRHFVLSNSSFSWWAQALCRNDNKLVTVPSPWVMDGRKPAVYLPEFHVIKTVGKADF